MPTVRSRFTAERGSLESALAVIQAGEDENGLALPGLYATLRDVLGYETGEYSLKTDGPVIRVAAPGITAGAPLAIIEASAVDAVEDLLVKDAGNLLVPYVVDEWRRR